MNSNTSRRELLQAGALLAVARAICAPNGSRAPAGKEAYELASDVLYLNHASIGTVPRVVREAHVRYLEICETNPWLYVWGEAWASAFEDVHERAARKLVCPLADVAVTRNTTAAFGLAANGLDFVEGERDEVVFSSLNHVGASASFEHAAAARGYRVRRFAFPERDVPDLSASDVVRLYAEALDERSALLVLPHVDNVVGLRHPVAAIARMAREAGVRYICVDGAQTIGMFDVDVGALGVDLYATSAHKWLQAPKGTGLLVLSDAIRSALRPLTVTWGSERWEGTARAYTDFGARALPALLAVGDALRFHQLAEEEGMQREAHHRELFEQALATVDAHSRLAWRSPRAFDLGASLFSIEVQGAPAARLANTLFQDAGIVVRPFEGGADGRNLLRVSPNTMNDGADLERFFQSLDDAL